MNRPATKRGLTSGDAVFVSAPSTRSETEDAAPRKAVARPGGTCRCTSGTRSTSQCCRHPRAGESAGPEELAAWRIVRACVLVRCAVPRGLVRQVERRGGGLALARGGDKGAAAGAALDHVVAPGNLEVAGRHGRRRRWRRRGRRRRRERRRRRRLRRLWRRWGRILRADCSPREGLTLIRGPREGGAAQ
eukprot:scaffold22248_cov60-Phaeocystis_antarctica.AAC.3